MVSSKWRNGYVRTDERVVRHDRRFTPAQQLQFARRDLDEVECAMETAPWWVQDELVPEHKRLRHIVHQLSKEVEGDYGNHGEE